MLAPIIACVAVARQTGETPNPPKARYDALRDVTIYSTGDVRTAGYSGYGARFEFPGKTPSIPSSIEMGFGCLRLSHGQGAEQDQALLHWNGVNTISISFGGQAQEYPAVHAFKVSANKEVTMFLGRTLEESLSVSLTPGQFRAISAAESLHVELGKDIQDIKGKSLLPLKRLAACIPETHGGGTHGAQPCSRELRNWVRAKKEP